MQPLQFLILHCSATPSGRDVQPADIIRMHTAKPPQGRGWSRVGYGRFITLDGTVHKLVDYNENKWMEAGEITNGAAGYNGKSRHICYAGGMSADMKRAQDTRTEAQRDALANYVKATIKHHADIQILGHNQVNPGKACPSFNVPAWLREIGIPEKNIYKA